MRHQGCLPGTTGADRSPARRGERKREEEKGGGRERGVKGNERKRCTYESGRRYTPCYFGHHSPGVSGKKVLCRVVQGHQDVRLHLVRGLMRREEAGKDVCVCVCVCVWMLTCQIHSKSL